MTRKTYDKLFEEWKYWRGTATQPGKDKLPNKFLHPTKRKAFEAFNEATWSPVYKGSIFLEGIKQEKYNFNTSGSGATKTPTIRFVSPIRIVRNRKGQISKVEINQDEVEHLKWLLRNPRLIVNVISEKRNEHQRIQDSALFL